MREDLRRLYATLAPTRVQSAQVFEEAMAGPETEASLADGDDNVPLLPEQVDQLRQLFRQSPEAVKKFLKAPGEQRELTDAEAERRIDELDEALKRPSDTSAELESIRWRPRPIPPPTGFGFDGYDAATIAIDSGRTDFEEKSDWLGYAIGGGLNGALHHAGLLPMGPIRRHDEHQSGFAYDLDSRPGGEGLSIALFADFANGYYHSLYMAKLFERRRYPYAIHLGDVYYGGRTDEVRAYLEQPLAPVLAQTELFLLAGNHEMYSKGRPWLDYIDRKRNAAPTRQRQEGTYFRLRPQGFQIIGIDTEWFGHMRYREPFLREWLESSLRQGRKEGRANILLSSNEPYEYGKTGTTTLLADLADVVDAGLVDLWFWGNTHYCALFERTGRLDFLGSCIGHGGFPYYKIDEGWPSAAQTRFVEKGTRFGDGTWSDPRPDVGANGFCEMTLNADGSVVLSYVDWMGRLRHSTRLVRDGQRLRFAP